MEMYRVYRTKHRYYLKTWEVGSDEAPRLMSCAKRHILISKEYRRMYKRGR